MLGLLEESRAPVGSGEICRPRVKMSVTGASSLESCPVVAPSISGLSEGLCEAQPLIPLEGRRSGSGDRGRYLVSGGPEVSGDYSHVI